MNDNQFITMCYNEIGYSGLLFNITLITISLYYKVSPESAFCATNEILYYYLI